MGSHAARDTPSFPLRHALPERLGEPGFALERWRVSDEPVLGALVAESREHLAAFMPWASSEPASPTERRALLERWEQEWAHARGAGYKVPDDEGGACGVISLSRKPAPQLIEIGYWLAPRATGAGRITRAARILTAFALAQPEVEVVVIRHDVANVASGAVPARLGFRRRSASTRPAEAPGERGILVEWVAERGRWSTQSAT